MCCVALYTSVVCSIFVQYVVYDVITYCDAVAFVVVVTVVDDNTRAVVVVACVVIFCVSILGMLYVDNADVGDTGCVTHTVVTVVVGDDIVVVLDAIDIVNVVV